ncbi:hypothetical protein RchiOBHm_Chr2g0142031 [Rosa chinensis]|uniref:Uncharacterized protein n=1 Tax=Rosa chinensis TaxID=74649 RepID=A0A2P6RXS8_ROSCH|nr:hypothetical protein RchiOBHm_Chr2g0142031 [Rosa chinensis]
MMDLSCELSIHSIKNSFFAIGSLKAPGTDGISASFFRRQLNVWVILWLLL